MPKHILYPLLMAAGILLLTLLLLWTGRVRPRWLRPVTALLLALWGAAWLTLLLLRTPGESLSYKLEPLRTLRLAFKTGSFHYGKAVSRALMNLLVFIPFGLLTGLRLSRGRLPMPVRVLLWGIACSLLIEVAELVTLRGCFETDDLIANTLGSLLGGLLCLPISWLTGGLPPQTHK